MKNVLKALAGVALLFAFAVQVDAATLDAAWSDVDGDKVLTITTTTAGNPVYL